MPTASLAHARLRQRSEGAILVVGILMGMLMVGALWNLVSIGDAILWREHLQDAADAAAFENAVWNARGMNIIVFLNIVMAAAMAILVALRGTILLLTGAIAALHAAKLACLLAWFPSGITQALCALGWTLPNVLQPALTTARNLETSARRSIPRFIDGVKRAQQVVATVSPLVGVKESTLRTSSEYNMMAAGLSPSLAPNNVVGAPRIGLGVSLPVEEGAESTLCEKAGRFVPNELLSLLEAAGVSNSILNAAGGFIRDMAGNIAGSLPSVFCGNMAPGDISQLNTMLRDAARDSCGAAERGGPLTDQSQVTQEERTERERFSDYWTQENGQDVFNTQRCEDEQFAQASQQAQNQPTEGKKPADVWSYTKNGDFFMQSWGLSFHTPPHQAGNDRGLDFAAGGNGAGMLDANVHRLGTAQAEMYYNCEAVWDDCKGDAMWTMNWKARLRRVHNPAEMAARSISQIAIDQVVGAVENAISTITGGAETAATNWIGQNAQQGGFWSQAWGFLRGNLWSNIYPRLPWDPIGWTTGQVEETVSGVLAREPPAPSEVIIH
jgi:hypothetical protein